MMMIGGYLRLPIGMNIISYSLSNLSQLKFGVFIMETIKFKESR